MSAPRRLLARLLLRPRLRRLPLVERVWRSGARRSELGFWRDRADLVGDGKREWVYTELVGVDGDWFAGKRLLDVGCGPRGSLDWAAHASRRVGLDPLAERYVSELGVDTHAMEYVAGVAEAMPFDDGSFDWVGCVNALDHVDDPARAAREIARVLAPDGMLVLVTDVGHRARLTEPQTFGWEVLDLFSAAFDVVEEKRVVDTGDGMDESLREGRAQAGDGPGILVARLHRTALLHDGPRAEHP